MLDQPADELRKYTRLLSIPRLQSTILMTQVGCQSITRAPTDVFEIGM